MEIRAIKTALLESAEIASDCDEILPVAYMPDLSWWSHAQVDLYMEVSHERPLSQTTVLIGNLNTLSRWLLPDRKKHTNPGPRDIAKASVDLGANHVLVTGIVKPDTFLENVFANPHEVMVNRRFERFNATFCGAGDTLSARACGT